MSYLCLGLAAFFGLAMLSMADAAQGESDDKPVVVFETTAGPITLELDRARAPITVDNFLKYVDSGYFNSLIFHRVIPGFMIQGGGMDESMRERTEGQLPPIRNEASNGLSNKRGTICMARTSDPNSATSQFFINLVDNAQTLDPRPGSAGYAVFGRVIAGMDTVDSIAKVPTGRKGMHDDVPLKPITIKSAKRKPKS
jgi:peptidyl-prolyl cis-trans isomerase A (cyclophilin A)